MLLLTTTQCVQGQTLSRCLGNALKIFDLSLHRILTPTLSEFEIFNETGYIIQNWVFLVFFANIFHHPKFIEEFL